MPTPRSDAFIFFGATGDLATKQIWPALAALTKSGRLDMPVVAIGRKEIGVDGIREKAKKSLEAAKALEPEVWQTLSSRLAYVAVDYDEPETFDGIKKAIGGAKAPLSYVALPPDVIEKVAGDLARAGLAKDGRFVVEKPFGHDSASAKALSEALYASYPEEAIFRIDHYLGKEQVENLVYFRAANPLFEATWNQRELASVEITMAEKFGVKGRAEFYDGVGAVRDVVQNHLLEVVACLAMELPGEPGHAALRDARTALLASVKALLPEDLIRGQVRGYEDEKGVAKGSTTETFAALKVFIDSPRWAGVPFHIRTGKSLAVTATEVIVRAKAHGHPVLDDERPPRPNALRFRLGPDHVVALTANVKSPGEAMSGAPSELVLQRSAAGMLKPYERLLGDAIDGDTTMYARRESVEESWRIVETALRAETPLHPYDEASWGPEEANRLAPPGGWTNPQG